MSVFIPPSLRQIPLDQLNKKADQLKRLFDALDETQRAVKVSRKLRQHLSTVQLLKMENETEDMIGLALEGLTDQQAEDLVDWATAEGVLTA